MWTQTSSLQVIWKYQCWPCVKLRAHAQNTTNPVFSLVVYNIVPLLIGPLLWPPKSSIMYPLNEGTRPCPFPVTGNGHGRVTAPTGEWSYFGHDPYVKKWNFDFQIMWNDISSTIKHPLKVGNHWKENLPNKKKKRTHPDFWSKINALRIRKIGSLRKTNN